MKRWQRWHTWQGISLALGVMAACAWALPELPGWPLLKPTSFFAAAFAAGYANAVAGVLHDRATERESE